MSLRSFGSRAKSYDHARDRDSEPLAAPDSTEFCEYAADIRDLKTSIDTTRRALDPEQLGLNVSKNINHFMGQSVQAFAKSIQRNLDVSLSTQSAANQTSSAAQKLTDKLSHVDIQTNRLAHLTTRLEDRDQ